MYREQFVRENPEKAAQQDRDANRWILRLVTIVSVWIAAIVSTQKYCTDEEFRAQLNHFPEKLFSES